MEECFFDCCYSFGKRTGGSARRPNECFVLEPSEMIVVSRFFFLICDKWGGRGNGKKGANAPGIINTFEKVVTAKRKRFIYSVVRKSELLAFPRACTLGHVNQNWASERNFLFLFFSRWFTAERETAVVSVYEIFSVCHAMRGAA